MNATNALRRFQVSCLLVVMALTGGCALRGGTAPEFEGMATAGVAYADTMPALFEESMDVKVGLDSALPADSRAALPRQARGEELTRSDEVLFEYAGILADLDRHNRVLKSYVVALQALATSDAPAEAGDAATGFVPALDGISIARSGNWVLIDAEALRKGIVVGRWTECVVWVDMLLCRDLDRGA